MRRGTWYIKGGWVYVQQYVDNVLVREYRFENGPIGARKKKEVLYDGLRN